MEAKKNLQPVPVIAKLFNLSERSVQRLAAEGVLPYVSARPYQFDLLPTIQAYIRHLTARIEERGKSEEFEQAAYDKLRAEANYKQHKADILRMERKEMEKNMLDADMVKDAYEDILLIACEKLAELPEKLDLNELAAEKNAQKVSAEISEACRQILNELSEYQYDPEEAEQRRKYYAAK